MSDNGQPVIFRTVETDERVPGEPELVTRFRWRAERRRRRLQSFVRFPFYRWEIVPWHNGDVARTMPRPSGCRWAVVAMQNVAEPVKEA
jgi:hypothetical protein